MLGLLQIKSIFLMKLISCLKGIKIILLESRFCYSSAHSSTESKWFKGCVTTHKLFFQKGGHFASSGRCEAGECAGSIFDSHTSLTVATELDKRGSLPLLHHLILPKHEHTVITQVMQIKTAMAYHFSIQLIRF